METIGGWVALIAATSIVGAVFASIIPSGKMKTAFSVLTGIILVCAVVSPLATEKPEIDFGGFSLELEEKKSEYKTKSEEAMRAVAEEGFQKAVLESLKEGGFEVAAVEVKCNGEYQIERVTVIIAGSFEEETVKKKVKELCKNNAEIKIKKGESDENKAD